MSLLGGHRVYFKYDEEEVIVRKNKEQVRITKPVTTCVIETEDKQPVSEGVVKLYHKDINNKLVARECAFRKAVKQIGDKITRHNIRHDFRENIRLANV